MIDDRIEDGLCEEDAVKAVGTVDEIAAQIVGEYRPAENEEKVSSPKRKLKAWEIVLLILGAPLWIPLLMSVFSVILSLYITVWSGIISFWAVFGSLVGVAFGGLLGGIVTICTGNALSGIATVGVSLACGGLAIFAFLGCRAASDGVILLTKKIILGIKNSVAKNGGDR
jgi:uncharacterized membrane protein